MNAKPHTNLRRNRLAAVGVIPLLLLAPWNLTALGFESIYLSTGVATWLLPAVLLGLIATGVLARDCWGLAVGKPSSPTLRLLHRRILGLTCVLAVAALLACLHAGAHSADGVLYLVILTTLLALLATAVILVAAGAALARTTAPRHLKSKEAILIVVAWVVVFGAGHALMWQEVFSMKRLLRVETSSRHPFIVALCHGDHDKASALMPSAGEQGASEAASCIPDDFARYKQMSTVGDHEAGMRLTLVIEAVKQNDPLLNDRTRGDGPCTVAEANLLRRLQHVAPSEVHALSIWHMPTTCAETDGAGARSAPLEAPTAASVP